MLNLVSMDELSLGHKGIVRKVLSTGSIRRRFLDIGLVDGTCVECVLEDSHRNFLAYLIRGAVIAIRASDLKSIMVERCEV